eukprot:13096150-Ditylum_brightwellii.AAC.1
MAGNIGNAFCTASCAEKIWSVAGDQFGNKKGSIVVLNRALYGLKTASASFHQFLGVFPIKDRPGFVVAKVGGTCRIRLYCNAH